MGDFGPWVSETFDVDVLVHATHRASPFHDKAKTLVERFLAGPGLVAVENIEQFTSRPHVRQVGEANGFWPVYRRVADPVKPRGNLVPDAHLVALMRHHGIATIWSHDRDFRKFEGIRIRDPFSG